MAEIESIQSKLIKIQAELKAPKNQKNTFGNYMYRSCEDILEAVKPLLSKYELSLTISDKVQQIGERYYVEAIVMLRQTKSDSVMDLCSVTAYAREAETKKGMDESQITGAASSYARKYALNGMFCIDDTKDADSFNNSTKTVQRPLKMSLRTDEEKAMIVMNPSTGKQLITIRGLLHQLGVEDKTTRDNIVAQANTFTQASKLIEELMKKIENKKKAEIDEQI